MVLGKVTMPGHPTCTYLVYSKTRTIALAARASEVVWTFPLSCIISLFFLPLSDRRSNID